MIRISAFLLCGTLLGPIVPAAAQTPMQMHHHEAGEDCPTAALACASTATPAFGPDGKLWVAWAAGGSRVAVARSPDLGKSFAAPSFVTPAPAKLDTGPDSRPSIVIDKAGQLTVGYAIFKDEHYNGQVLISHSTNGGASFGTPYPVTTGAASQRFATLGFDPAGNLFAAWLDKRNVAAARAKGEEYVGAALAVAWSENGGVSFSTTRIAQDDTCECCRLGLAFAGPGKPVILFRDVFGGTVRDHAIISFAAPATPGPLYRVSTDDWAINACPHHGPSLAISADGTYHAAWFTNGKVRQGLFYARSEDGGKNFSAPMPIGRSDHDLSRPAVTALGQRIWLGWKDFDGETTTVHVIASGDDGKTWSAPKEAARTADASDHPLLVNDGHNAYLSWLTHVEGYRLVPLEAVP